MRFIIKIILDLQQKKILLSIIALFSSDMPLPDAISIFLEYVRHLFPIISRVVAHDSNFVNTAYLT